MKLKKDGTISHEGEGAGKPLKYPNEKAFDDICVGYFKDCIKTKEIPSKAGLRVVLDISRETYGDYKKRYPYAIKRAENLIEKAWVQRLNGMGATGAIFYLKNAFREDYKDRYENDVTSGGLPLPILGGIAQKPDEIPKHNGS